MSLAQAALISGHILALSLNLCGIALFFKKWKLWAGSYSASTIFQSFFNSGKSLLCSEKVGFYILANVLPLLVLVDAEDNPLEDGGCGSVSSLDKLARISSRAECSYNRLASRALLCRIL